MTYLKQLLVKHKAKTIIFLSAFIFITLFSNLSPIYKFCDMPDPFTWLAQSSQILEGKILSISKERLKKAIRVGLLLKTLK